MKVKLDNINQSILQSLQKDARLPIATIADPDDTRDLFGMVQRAK